MASGWLTRYVASHGYQVQMVDFNAELYATEPDPAVRACWDDYLAQMDASTFVRRLFEGQGDRIRKRLEEIYELGCRVFGLMVYSGNAHFAGALSAMIKEIAPDAHVIAGGTGVTSLYRHRRRYGEHQPLRHPVDEGLSTEHRIDAFVLGEGEHTLLDALRRLEDGRDLRGMGGVVLAEDGPFARFKERALIKNLDALPHATYDGFDMGLYHFPSLAFQLARGCSWSRCSHCGLKGYSRGFRMRSPEHAINEMEYHVKRHGVREFHFADLDVNGDLAGLERFCDAVIASKLDIQWQSFFHINPKMTSSLLDKIAASGCHSINYGFETGSDVVLQVMRKRYRAADAARLLRKTRAAGINPVINIMCGHPGETEQELEKNLKFLTDNAENIHMVAGVVGTAAHVHSPMVDQADRFGIEVDPETGDWRSIDGSIDQRIRNERVHRTVEHLRLLGIPAFVALWERRYYFDERDQQGPDEERWIYISGMQVVDDRGSDRSPLSVDRPLKVQVEYRSSSSVRFVVFDLELYDLQGRLVFQTPPSSQQDRIIEVKEGGWIQLAFGAGELLPGQYVLAVRARLPRTGGASGGVTGQQQALDFHVRRVPLTLVGLGQVPAKYPVAHTWTHRAGALPRVNPGLTMQVRVLDGQGRERETLVSGEPMTVLLGIRHVEMTPRQLQMRIRGPGGRLVYQSEVQHLAPNSNACRWSVERLLLAPGPYLLELVSEAGGQQTVEPVHLLVRDPGAPRQLGLTRVTTAARALAPGGGSRAGSPGAGPGPKRMADGLPGERVVVWASGEALTVRLPLSGLGTQGWAPTWYRVWVTDSEGRLLASSTELAQVCSPHEDAELELELEANLLAGNYALHLARWDPTDDGPAGPELTFQLEVPEHSRREGGGLVRAPHSLSISARHRPQRTLGAG